MTKSKEGLKPCPLCECDVRKEYQLHLGMMGWLYECEGCNLQWFHEESTGEDEGDKFWNTRNLIVGLLKN